MPTCILLPNRGVLSVAGDDRVSFLQGLVSNDVRKAGPDRALFSAFLTAQGKYLHDFFIVDAGGRLLLDCEGERAGDLLKRLKIYRLRAKVDLADATADFAVAAVIGDDAATRFDLPPEAGGARAWAGGIAFVDPRLAGMGVRLVLPRAGMRADLDGLSLSHGTPDDYDRLRLLHGIPDGSRDIAVDKATLLESNYDVLNAIAWDKGCYMGQELTARTRYRGLVKRRLVPVRVDGPLPPTGTPITLEGREVGEIRSGLDDRALAVLRLEVLDTPAADLSADGTRVHPCTTGAGTQ